MDLDFMLLGKTGVGKSQTGNSILGYKAFESKPSFCSVTVDSKRDVAELDDGRKICVVDTPGLGDTGCTEEEGMQMFTKAIKEAIAMSPQGYHALLLPFRFGTRLTKEDANVISDLKKLFGKKFIKKHCIVIITNGDMYRTDENLVDVPFLDWCEEQKGHFQALYAEVNKRVILFDNRGTADVKAAQRDKLINMVDNLMAGGQRYTDEKFERARKVIERIKKKEQENTLSNELRDETSLILAKFVQIRDGTGFKSIDEKIDALTILRVRSCTQLDNLKDEKITTALLHQVKFIIIDVNSKIEKEIDQLVLHKELEEKRRHDQEQASARVRELEAIVKQHESELENRKRELEDLTDKFQTLRDGSNNHAVETAVRNDDSGWCSVM